MRQNQLSPALLLAFLLAGCSDTPPPSAAKSGESQLDADGVRALQAREAKMARAKLPPEMQAEGLAISDLRMSRKDKEMLISGRFTNGSGKPVEGINVKATYLDEGGIVLGGYNTVHYFQPAVPPGGKVEMVILAPLLGGASDSASKVEVDVLNLVVPGRSPDGWKPLDASDPED